MSYTYTNFLNGGCDCPGDKVVPLPAQCKRCNGSWDVEQTRLITQKRIWGTVRAAPSMFTMNLAALTVVGPTPSNDPQPQWNYVNWNQMSDRAVPSVIPNTMNVPRQRTRHRPGASGSGGPQANGVDVKHDSYARYLARKKAANLKTIKPAVLSEPLYGDKRYLVGMIPGCDCPTGA